MVTNFNIPQLPRKFLIPTIRLITKMTYHQKLSKMITAQNVETVYTLRSIRLIYENYKKYNRSLHYQVFFFANCLYIIGASIYYKKLIKKFIAITMNMNLFLLYFGNFVKNNNSLRKNVIYIYFFNFFHLTMLNRRFARKKQFAKKRT